ncbi:DBF4-type zinc finger-containing protein 2 isoform X2 [Oncorhynchus masou masou]
MDTVSRGEREEEQPGPSRVPPPRQGYCSCCQILYNNVEQHILSPRHREVVHSTRTYVPSGSLMERFLSDVIQHHPHLYNDPRPTHADLPSLSSPLVPREELLDLCASNDDRASFGTREHMPSSDDSSCQLVYVQEADVASETRTSQPEEGRGGNVGSERLTPTAPDRDIRPSSEEGTHSHPPSPDHLPTHPTRPCSQKQTPPPLHRKAHRKTNRRRERGSNSSSSIHPPCSPASPQLCATPTDQITQETPENQPPYRPRDWTTDPKPRTVNTGWAAWAGVPPWRRRETQKEQAFSSDHSDPEGDTIEEVIQRHCYGRSPTQHHQRDHNIWTGGERGEARGDTDSFHLSLPGSLGVGSGSDEDWDTPVQVAIGRGQERRKDIPVVVGLRQGGGEREGRALACLMEVQVNMEDQVYTSQLDSALNPETRTAGEAGMGETEGEMERTVEEILPALPHIPVSFLGKTWTQVLLEDEQKVENMVREFRQGRFICYFTSESLTRHGKRSSRDMERGQKEGLEDGGWVPLGDHDNEDDDPECHRRGREVFRRRKVSRSYRLASRCQVVKVSHGTQTTAAIIPTIRQRTLDQTGTSPDILTLPCQDPGVDQEKTPMMKTRLCSLRLPVSYSRIMTPLQPKTTLIYVLSSPETPPFDPKPRLRPIARGNRGRKRSCDGCEGDVGAKVKYKRVPLRYYDPATHRILKTPPKGLNLTPSSSGLPRPPQSHVVRQLFRSLSPDINTERQGGEGGRDGSGGRRRGRSGDSVASGSLLEAGGSFAAEGQGSSEAGSSVTTPFSRSSLSNSSRFLLSTLSPDTNSNPEVTRQRRRRGAERKLKTDRPLTPEKDHSPPYRPWTRGGRGERQPARRSSKRGRPPQISPPPKPPPPQDLSPTVGSRKGFSRRIAESKKLPRPKSPARGVTSTPLKQAIRTPSRRSSPDTPLLHCPPEH